MRRAQLPPLAAVRVFDAAARHGSFTAASEELGLTQAAVSYQVKALEGRVGAALFERHARGAALTPTGRRFAARVSEAMSILSDAYAEAKGLSQGTLSISVIPTFATNFLARRLGLFQLGHPDIAVRMEIGEALADFLTDGVDVAIRGGKGDWEGLISRFLLPTVFTPMLSPELAESIGGLREPRDLLKLPILSPNDPWWRRWLALAGVESDTTDQKLATQMGAQVVEANAAIAGHGVAMLTPAFFQTEIALGQLMQPFDLVGDDGRGYWLVYPESWRNSGKIRKFWRWLEMETQALRETD